MPRHFFVGGNFKMNPTSLKAVDSLVNELSSADIDPNTEVVIAPPSLYLIPALALVSKSETKTNLSIAAQNCYSEEKGAFTGEISPHMLIDAGVPWVIVGHSERRTLFKDTSLLVGQKTQKAVGEGLKVILCIGETLEEREKDLTMTVCETMLAAVVENVKEADWSKIVIAYEPVWAIGTGKVASSAQAQEVHHSIRAWLSAQVSQKVAEETRIIYGGSVTAANSKELATQPDIDGFLVGGASLKPEFKDICNSRR